MKKRKKGTTCQPRPDTMLPIFQRVASKTSLLPPTSRSNNTNLELKVRPQDKPGTTKEAQRHRCCLNKWPAGQAWYHRVARSNKTNHEPKSDQQDKPGTTKKTI